MTMREKSILDLKRKIIKEKEIKREYELLKFLTENNMELVWEFDTETGEGICIFNDGIYKSQKINNIYNYYLKHIHSEDIKKVENEIKDVIVGVTEFSQATVFMFDEIIIGHLLSEDVKFFQLF